MPKMNPKLDAFIARAKTWRAETEALRAILLDCGLDEALKWGKPCYAMNGGGNVAIIQSFKDFCALMFFKGTLLTRGGGLLVSQGENSQAALRAEFRSVAEIAQAEPALRACIAEAIAVEEAGLKVAFRKPSELVLPDELASRLEADPALDAAFHALTPGRQRSYVLHIAGAKRSETRAARVDRCAPAIRAGKGYNER